MTIERIPLVGFVVVSEPKIDNPIRTRRIVFFPLCASSDSYAECEGWVGSSSLDSEDEWEIRESDHVLGVIPSPSGSCKVVSERGVTLGFEFQGMPHPNWDELDELFSKDKEDP